MDVVELVEFYLSPSMRRSASRSERIHSAETLKNPGFHEKSCFCMRWLAFTKEITIGCCRARRVLRTCFHLCSSVERIHSAETLKNPGFHEKSGFCVRWLTSREEIRIGYCGALVEFYLPPSMKISGSSSQRIHSPKSLKNRAFYEKSKKEKVLIFLFKSEKSDSIKVINVESSVAQKHKFRNGKFQNLDFLDFFQLKKSVNFSC